MSYLYKAHCYDTKQELYAVVAADCSPTGNGSYIFSCSPDQSGITISVLDIATNTSSSISYASSLIECAPQLQATIDLSWKLVLVLIAGWVIKQMINAIRTR
jgi:hypothetical protein